MKNLTCFLFFFFLFFSRYFPDLYHKDYLIVRCNVYSFIQIRSQIDQFTCFSIQYVIFITYTYSLYGDVFKILENDSFWHFTIRLFNEVLAHPMTLIDGDPLIFWTRMPMMLIVKSFSLIHPWGKSLNEKKMKELVSSDWFHHQPIFDSRKIRNIYRLIHNFKQAYFCWVNKANNSSSKTLSKHC